MYPLAELKLSRRRPRIQGNKRPDQDYLFDNDISRITFHNERHNRLVTVVGRPTMTTICWFSRSSLPIYLPPTVAIAAAISAPAVAATARSSRRSPPLQLPCLPPALSPALLLTLTLPPAQPGPCRLHLPGPALAMSAGNQLGEEHHRPSELRPPHDPFLLPPL